MKEWQAIYEAAKQLNQNLSMISWNGFVVAGDEISIKEVRRLMDCESRLRWFETEYYKSKFNLEELTK